MFLSIGLIIIFIIFILIILIFIIINASSCFVFIFECALIIVVGKLTDYKSAKFEFGEAERYFRVVSPTPSKLDSNKKEFWYFLYQVDNCLSNLSSMWDGLIEELRCWLLENGHIDAEKKNRLYSNTSVIDLLSEVGNRADVADKLNNFFNSESVGDLKKTRDLIIHRKFEKNIHVNVLNYIDFVVVRKKDANEMLFFRDLPAYYQKLTKFISEIRSELNLLESDVDGS